MPCPAQHQAGRVFVLLFETPPPVIDLYKSLQSGSQAALPPHLQLAFSDANQSQGSDMKRKSH
ncbi:hypothetical protein N1851_002958 [Merluccius polli]|uniref:Uncharacterized protein n=1 Tax=Merluccius polli TaxID=89951 RepID=A0AA47PAN7_MERPO|nr:hypothetical protein N1851_002958 [Merluccius polli]